MTHQINENTIKQVREVSDAMQMVAEAFGKLTIPEDCTFIAHKLVTLFQITADKRDGGV